MPAGLIIAGWLLGFTSLSYVLTLWSIQYARHARLIDQPGRRRSHDQPVLRGGVFLQWFAAHLCGMVDFCEVAR